MCSYCDLWFQHPQPPKVFEASHEKTEDGTSNGHLQSQRDLDVAAQLARLWAHNWIARLPLEDGKKYRALDVGCKYPWFAKTLREQGVDAYGIDGLDQDDPNLPPITNKFMEELKVPMMLVDFEKVSSEDIMRESGGGKFHAVSMIHVFEHIYDAIVGLENIHDLLDPNGFFLVRVPSHDSEGFERDLTPGHYSIHPYFYSEKAFRYLIEEKTKLFDIVETYPMWGQRDYILTPRKP